VTKQDFLKLFQRAVQLDASDIHMKTGSPPYFRVDGVLAAQSRDPLLPDDLDVAMSVLLNADQKAHFARHGEVDLSYNEKGNEVVLVKRIGQKAASR